MRRASEMLLAEMREALLAELGALEAYRALSRRPWDEELLKVLVAFHHEELELVEGLRTVIQALGGRARRRSWRRRIAARLLAASTRCFGPRFALRVCQEAEATVSRWYREFAVYLARTGELEHARRCEEFSRTKARHASTLNAWTELMLRV